MMKLTKQDESLRPLNITILDDGSIIEIMWTNGNTIALHADLLWKNCPSAAGRRRRIDNYYNAPKCENLQITAIQPIGNYAINIAFSDGHDRGIYPWGLLHELSAKPQADDFIIVD